LGHLDDGRVVAAIARVVAIATTLWFACRRRSPLAVGRPWEDPRRWPGGHGVTRHGSAAKSANHPQASRHGPSFGEVGHGLVRRSGLGGMRSRSSTTAGGWSINSWSPTAAAELERRLAKLAPPADRHRAALGPAGRQLGRGRPSGRPDPSQRRPPRWACRPRYRAAPGKSDPGDLADILRTDGPCPDRARRGPCADRVPDRRCEALQALVRGRDDLVSERVALGNRLQALLDGFWPGAAAIGACPAAAQGADRGANLTAPIALAFLQRTPTPHSAARLGEKRLGWPSKPTAAGGPRPSCSGACAKRFSAAPARSRARPRATWSAR